MLTIKQGSDGARIAGLRPEMIIALIVAEGVFAKHNLDCRLTCGTDGVHKEGSLHYVGLAVDIGLPHRISAANQIDVILGELKIYLEDEFDVVLEGDHYHIEFQPKKALNKN